MKFNDRIGGLKKLFLISRQFSFHRVKLSSEKISKIFNWDDHQKGKRIKLEIESAPILNQQNINRENRDDLKKMIESAKAMATELDVQNKELKNFSAALYIRFVTFHQVLSNRFLSFVRI